MEYYRVYIENDDDNSNSNCDTYEDTTIDITIDPNNRTKFLILEVLGQAYPDKIIKSIKKLPACEGCRSDLLGQEGHMNPGGCLYDCCS